MNAGDYSYRLQWLQCSRTADGTTGDRPKTYTLNGYLWSSIELQSATVQNEYGAQRTQASGTIRLRNWPAIQTIDRIYSIEHDQTFVIDGVRKDLDNNETILDVHTLELD